MISSFVDMMKNNKQSHGDGVFIPDIIMKRIALEADDITRMEWTDTHLIIRFLDEPEMEFPKISYCCQLLEK